MLSTSARSVFQPLAAVRQLARAYAVPAAAQQAQQKIKFNKLLINGQFVDAQSGKTFETINPATEEVLAHVAEGDTADVDIAVQAARAAFETGPWSKTSAAERGRILYKVADLMEQNIDELAALEALDNGKPFNVARNVDLQLAIKCLRYYAGWADKIHGKVIPMEGPYMCYTRHEPVGVAAQIIPWNFPALMQAWKLGPAIATGCTIVMKPAEQTPLSALYVGNLFHQAGLPAGVLNIIPGFGETAGNALVVHKDVDKIAFTGSTEIGKLIQRGSGASNLKRVTLELGGKSPNIIFDDCNIEAAIAQSQTGLFLNQGQCCIAGSRLFVQESIYDEFVEKSVKAAKARKLGSQFEDVDQGPQVSKEQQEKILGLIEKGKQEGATLEVGGSSWGDRGFFVQPTVFTNVQDDHTIAQEEIFGPVMSILKFKDEDEVIARANNSHYGLGAGLMTNNIERAHRVVNSIKSGTVYVNCYDVFSASAPFGGFKQSGIGRELGEYALSNYTEIKSVITKLDERTRY